MADDAFKRTYRTNERAARDVPAPAPESPPDPLMELARLIGQNDPFAYDAGGSARHEPRPVARNEPPVPRTQDPRIQDLSPIPRWPEAQGAPRVDDRFAARAGDPPRPARPQQSDEPRRAGAFDDPLQHVSEPLPKSYSEPMYPRAEDYPGEYGQAAEPRGYERLTPPEHGYRTDYGEGDGRAYPVQDESYPVRDRDERDPSDALDDPAHAQDDPRYAATAHDHYAAHDDYDVTGDGRSAPYGGYADGEGGRYYDEDESDYEGRGQDRRGKLLMVAAVAALAIVGTAGAYGFRSMGSKSVPSAPPVIKADNTPNKIASAGQSGEGNKEIYERLGGQGERMVSREEQPIDTRGLVPAVAPVFPDGPVSAPTAIPVPPANPPRGPVPMASAPAAPQPGGPKAVRTVTIKPDQQGSTAAPAQRAPSRPSAGPLPLNPQGVSPDTVAAPPSPRPQVALASPAVPRAVESGNGNYVVQLSALKSESEAQASFRAMQTKYPGVLGGQKPLIRKKDLGAKGIYYGAQVGPFASREEAVQLCESLKSAGGTCIVQKN